MVSKIKHFLKDEFIIHSSIVFMGTIVTGAFNLFYHLVSVRLLTPEDYGTFNALISFAMLISMAASPLSTTLTRFFTEYIAKKKFAALKSVFVKVTKRLCLAACLILAAFFVTFPFLAAFLKTQPVYVILCGLIVTASLFVLPITPLFQSFQKFVVYSLLGIVASFGKLILGGLLMFLGLGVMGALSGFLIGPLLIFLTSLFFIPGLYQEHAGQIKAEGDTSASLVPIYRYFLPVALTMPAFTFLTSIDVILVKHFFSDLDAGYYSIAQMVGKVALYLPSALAIVILPKSTKAHVTNGSSLKLLHKSLILTAICGLAFTVFCFLAPNFILMVLTGKANPVSRDLVGLFVLSMSLYAVSWILIHFLLATHNLKFVLPLLAITILEACCIYFYHPTLNMVLYIFSAFSMASLLMLFFIVRFTHKEVVPAAKAF